MTMPESRDRLRFRDFTLDVRSYQLRRAGRPVRLERRPMDLLLLLVERRPDLVTHHEIADRLWGKDVFVDVETGIHGAIRKVRQALRDSPDRPVFVETVPARGYRFIAPVEVDADESVASAEAAAKPSVPSLPPAIPAADTGPVTIDRRFRRARIWTAALAVLVVIGFLAWKVFDAGESRVTLAVMPSENLSGDADRGYLADGLTEEMGVALDKLDPRRVSVLGRSSVRGYNRTTKSPSEIGRELGADYLVESSIRADAGRLRITAKLIRARDQVQVWSESFDREPAGILALQQELSAAIANQISVQLSAGTLDALSRRQTRNAEAYDLYLRGQNFANQRTPATTAKAIEYFTRATTLDPNYALAWSGIAFAHAASSINGDAPPLEMRPRARDAASRALSADPTLAEAHLVQGYVDWMFEWNWPAAEANLRHAVELNPRLEVAHRVLGHVLSQMGQHREAAPWMRRARELDPRFAMAFAMSAQVAFQARDYPQAIDFARQAIALDDELWIGYMERGQALERTGQDDLALEALNTAARFSAGNSKGLSLKGYILAKIGREQEARDVLAALDAASRKTYVPPYALALIHAGLGDRDAALASLERAYAARDVHLIFLPVDPKWDPYRNDRAFVDLLARCGFSRTSGSQ